MFNKNNVKNTDKEKDKGNAKDTQAPPPPPKAKKKLDLGEQFEPRISKAGGRTVG